MDKKIFFSAIAQVLLAATTTPAFAQDQELLSGASQPAAATASKQTATGNGTLPAPITDLSEASKAQLLTTL